MPPSAVNCWAILMTGRHGSDGIPGRGALVNSAVIIARRLPVADPFHSEG